MENEENLFDSGLYVGIAGTCISLVLRVIDLLKRTCFPPTPPIYLYIVRRHR